MSSPQHHTPESVLSLVSSLQPLLSQPQPLSPVTQAQLASLCVGLKQVNWHRTIGRIGSSRP